MSIRDRLGKLESRRGFGPPTYIRIRRGEDERQAGQATAFHPGDGSDPPTPLGDWQRLPDEPEAGFLARVRAALAVVPPGRRIVCLLKDLPLPDE